MSSFLSVLPPFPCSRCNVLVLPGRDPAAAEGARDPGLSAGARTGGSGARGPLGSEVSAVKVGP